MSKKFKVDDIEIQDDCKCSLCMTVFIEGEEPKFYGDENGYVRLAHLSCYTNKYGE